MTRGRETMKKTISFLRDSLFLFFNYLILVVSCFSDDDQQLSQ